MLIKQNLAARRFCHSWQNCISRKKVVIFDTKARFLTFRDDSWYLVQLRQFWGCSSPQEEGFYLWVPNPGLFTWNEIFSWNQKKSARNVLRTICLKGIILSCYCVIWKTKTTLIHEIKRFGHDDQRETRHASLLIIFICIYHSNLIGI